MRAFSDYFIDEHADVSLGHEGKCVRIRSDEGTVCFWFDGPRGELIAKAVVAAIKIAKGEEPNADA